MSQATLELFWITSICHLSRMLDEARALRVLESVRFEFNQESPLLLGNLQSGFLLVFYVQHKIRQQIVKA